MPIEAGGHLSAEAPSGTMKLAEWWGKIVFFLLCIAIAFLGVGRIEIPPLGLRLSSWSISRTVFFFWLIWKLLLWILYGRAGLGWRRISPPPPLLFFFVFVTASLLPFFFREAGDYRYFLFAFFHYIVVADLFSQGRRAQLLLCLLGIAPGFLLIRGILSHPSVLSLSRMDRFGFPLDHPNTAGYLFSMAIPLSLAVIASVKGWIRGLSNFSLGAQFAGLTLSYSRGAWLGCLVSLLGLALMEKRFRKAIVVLGLLGLLVIIILNPVRNRLVSLVDTMQDADMVWRLEVMAKAISLGIENPFWGAGYGREHLRAAIAEKYPGFFNQRFIPHSHNLYTELLSGTGFFGIGIFLWLLGSTLSRLLLSARREEIKERKILLSCLAASLLAFMVSGFGDVPFYHHETRIFFFTLLALIYLNLREKPAGLRRSQEC